MKSTKCTPSYLAKKNSKSLINSVNDPKSISRSKERFTPVKVPTINMEKVKANKTDQNIPRSYSPYPNKNENHPNGESNTRLKSNSKS